jgi:hypothetical protein
MLAGITACWHNSTMHDLRSYGMLVSETSVSISAFLAFLTLEKVRRPYYTVLAGCTH